MRQLDVRRSFLAKNSNAGHCTVDFVLICIQQLSTGVGLLFDLNEELMCAIDIIHGGLPLGIESR